MAVLGYCLVNCRYPDHRYGPCQQVSSRGGEAVREAENERYLLCRRRHDNNNDDEARRPDNY